MICREGARGLIPRLTLLPSNLSPVLQRSDSKRSHGCTSVSRDPEQEGQRQKVDLERQVEDRQNNGRYSDFVFLTNRTLTLKQVKHPMPRDQSDHSRAPSSEEEIVCRASNSPLPSISGPPLKVISAEL